SFNTTEDSRIALHKPSKSTLMNSSKERLQWKSLLRSLVILKIRLSVRIEKEHKEARFSNTFLRIQNERVKRNLYWTRIRAHEFYQEMIHGGFVFEERPNEAINVPIEDEKSPSSES
nr:hypothetical protein [Tanacetum cinerariifolium]